MRDEPTNPEVLGMQLYITDKPGPMPLYVSNCIFAVIGGLFVTKQLVAVCKYVKVLYKHCKQLHWSVYNITKLQHGCRLCGVTWKGSLSTNLISNVLALVVMLQGIPLT